MSRWEDEFEQNGLKATIDDARSFLDVEVEDIDTVHESEKRRLIKILDLLDTVIEGMDKEIAPHPVLVGLNNHLRHQSFWHQLSAYSNAPNVAHLVNANNHITSQLPIMYQLASGAKSGGASKQLKSVEKAYRDLASSIQKKSKKFEEAVSDQQEKLTEIIEDHATLVTEMEELENTKNDQLTIWQSEFSDKQIQRAEEFSNSQIELKKQFEAWSKSFEKSSSEELATMVNSRTNGIDEFTGEFTSQLEGYRVDAETKHKTIVKLFELVGADGITGGYSKVCE